LSFFEARATRGHLRMTDIVRNIRAM
jgi:hypothetical protein